MQREKDTTAQDIMILCFIGAIVLVGWNIISSNGERDRELRETQIRLEQTERTLLLQ